MLHVARRCLSATAVAIVCLLLHATGTGRPGEASNVEGSQARPPSAEQTWPDPEWEVTPPEAVSMSAARLESHKGWLSSKGQDRPYGAVIVRYGQIAFEQYGSGATRDSLWEIGSIRKAVASALLGMAIEEKRVTLDTLVRDVWPDIYAQTGDEKDKQIRVRQLFNSTSGWKHPEQPGSRWVYNNSAFTAGGVVLGRLYRRPDDHIADLADARIAKRIGAASWRCYHYPNKFSDSAGNPGPKLAIDSNQRDLARFGYLWLRGGRWNGESVIPAEYVREATRNQVADLGAHYGYCWFTNDDRKLLPDAPADAFFHVGNGKDDRRTVLAVIPSLDLVATIGTDASTYDITSGYRSVPVPHVNEWIGRVVEACVP